MKTSSLEFKQMQRDRIMKTKPWLNSTGAKTTKGRNISKMNALKLDATLHGLMQEAKAIFKMQREINNIIAI